jgi:SHS2 domain-containing protein
MTRGYEFFEHTADVGLIARGKTLTELFTHAAQGLVELIAEDSRLAPAESRTVSLTEDSVGDLLRAWLTQLLVWFDAERFVPAEYAVTVSETAVGGTVRGERFDPSRHVCGTEVKGVTRHQFRIERTPDGWAARIIFDV